MTRLLLVLVAWFRLFFGQYYHVVYVGGHPFGTIAQLLLVASYGDARLSQAQRACSQHNDSAFYRNAMPSRSPETIANIAITLIHQTDWLLSRLIEKLEKKFVESGGMRELMTKARKEYRGY